MRLLVTGAAGFLGAALTRALVGLGSEVHGILRPTTDAVRLHDLAGAIELHRVDLNHTSALRSVVETIRADVIIHTAAKLGHPGSGGERISAWADAVLGTVNLLEAVREVAPSRFVHVCSSTVFRDSDRPHTEADPLEPGTARGAAKAAALLAVRQWAEEARVPTTVVRPFSVYGPGEPRGRLIPELIHALRHDRPFARTRLDYRRDFVHSSDVVRGVLLATENEDAAGLAFNLGSGNETSTCELIALAERVSGRTLRLDSKIFPARASDRPHWSADISRARKVLGWSPAISLRDGLADLWSRS